MKFTIYLFIILTLFLASNSIAQAQNVILGNFSKTFFLNQLPSEINLTVNKNTYSLPKLEISHWLKENSQLTYTPHYTSEIENTNYCIYKKSFICQLTFSNKKSNHLKRTFTLTVNPQAIGSSVKDIARKANKDPENAKLKIDNGKVIVFTLSASGLQLEENNSIATIVNYLKKLNYTNPVILPFREIPPVIATSSVNNLGITSLIGEGRSNFIGSPHNRVYNIKVANKRFNGVLIKPKEEFSFIKTLGAVDADHGYLPELVIKKNKTEPDFGGGICQLSTTAFRAAINSGLEITARKNHAYPVSYYNPQGMDATVYIPRPDLKFINNTPGYILIEVKVKRTELIFDFYGTNDGRKVKIIGPTVIEKKPDGSLKTTFTQEVFDRNKKLIREDIFNSNYASPSKYPHPGSTPILNKTSRHKKHKH